MPASSNLARTIQPTPGFDDFGDAFLPLIPGLPPSPTGGNDSPSEFQTFAAPTIFQLRLNIGF